MKKKIILDMTPLERLVFESLLRSDKYLSYEEIVALTADKNRWNDRSIYAALKHLKEKGLIEEAGKIKVARTRAILYRSALTQGQFYEASHREHFEQMKDGSIDYVLSALSGYRRERSQSVIDEVEAWLQREKEILKKEVDE